MQADVIFIAVLAIAVFQGLLKKRKIARLLILFATAFVGGSIVAGLLGYSQFSESVAEAAYLLTGTAVIGRMLAGLVTGAAKTTPVRLCSETVCRFWSDLKRRA